MAKCAHCDAPKAKNRWDFHVCADKNTARVKHLCEACDMKLNRMVLRFMRDPAASKKMRNYKENKI